MKHFVFYTGIAILFTHELDSVANHEWRILPLTAWLPEQHAYTTFILLHIPIFATLIALIANNHQVTQTWTRTGISVFLVIHGLLHWAFMANANYEFSSLTSNLLIFGAMLFGIVYLTLEYFWKVKRSV